MKYLLFFTLALISCQKQDAHIEAIMAEFKKSANDPASIEYVETLAIDTLTENDARRNAIARGTRVHESMLRVVDASQGLMDVQAIGGGVDPATKSDHEKSVSEASQKSAEIDSIKSTLSSPDSNSVKEVYYYSSIRGKNAMGALILNRYKATFDSDGKLLDLSLDED